ncbi:MAG TPA: DMT family transporter [Pseudonocardiaceae bacterium]|nr:DMT family transporter [Pseudonocardiaceae bacterium]
MHPASLALLVSAAILHAAWNFAAKRVGAGGAVFVWCYYTISAALCLPIAIGNLFVAHVAPQWWWLVAALGTGVLHVGYGVILQRGYAVGDMSVVYPLARGTGPLLSVIVAVLVFGERPGVVGLLGVLAVVLGVCVISINPGAASAKPRLASVVYGVLTGAAIAGYTLWDDRAVTTLAMPPILYFTAGCLVQSALLTPHAAAHQQEVARLWRDHRREILVVAVLSPLAYLFVLFAMRTTPISVVAPVRELSIVIGSLVAWRVLAEPNPVRRLVGAAIVLSGIVGIAIG